MNHYYFIQKKGVNHGPYRLSELKNQILSYDQLVWRNDMDNWKKANQFPELEDIIVTEPPLTPKEQKIVEVNRNFKYIIWQIIYYYVLLSIILGIVSSGIALDSWHEYKFKKVKNTGRYSQFYPEMRNERIYSNAQSFWFRPFKAFYSTIYLTDEERNSNYILFKNLTLSSFASLSFIFFLIGVISYYNNRNKAIGTYEIDKETIKPMDDVHAKEVQYFVGQKEKIKYEETLTEHKQTQKEDENLKFRIDNLKKKLADANANIKSKKEKLEGWITAFIIVIVFFTSATIILLNNNPDLNFNSANSANNERLKELQKLNAKFENENNNLKNEKNILKKQDKINLLVETNGLKSKLTILENEKNDLSEKLTILKEENINKTQSNSYNYSNNTYQNLEVYLRVDCYLWDSPNYEKAELIKKYRAGDKVRIIRKVEWNVYYVEIDGSKGYIHIINNELPGF